METFASLLRAAMEMTPQDFATAFPHPVLLIYAHQADRDGSLRFETTRSLDPATGALVSLAEPRIEWVRKRDQSNAFMSMVTIGRAPNNDIVLDAQGVSSFHAYVLLTRGQCALVDAGSTYGTVVGQTRLKAREERRPLTGGEAVTLGSIPASFHTPASLFRALQQGKSSHPG